MAKTNESLDMAQWPLPKKIQYLKVWLQEQNLKKTGVNTYNKFEYFQLPDFLPLVNRKMFELDMFAKFEITPAKFNENGVVIFPEMAYLTISDMNGKALDYSCPTAENTAGGNPIQADGGKHSYYRRYLWIDCLDVAEGDEIDQTAGMPEKPKKGASPVKNESMDKPCTTAQIDALKTFLSAGEIEQIKKAKGLQELSDLTLKQMSDLIEWARKRKTNV